MTQPDSKGKGKKPVASVTTTSASMSQFFRMDGDTYLKVRSLVAKRTVAGRSASLQGLYLEAIKDYLERHVDEIDSEAKGA